MKAFLFRLKYVLGYMDLVLYLGAMSVLANKAILYLW